jgi:hypothetical protein
LVIDEEADRHGLDAVRNERLQELAVPRFRPSPKQAQHAGLARPIDVGVEQPYARAFPGQREREVHRNRRLADAALAGRDGQHIADARQRLQPVLHRMRHDLARDHELDLPYSQPGAMHAERLGQAVACTGCRETAADRHAPAVWGRRHGETRPPSAQSSARLGHDEGREMSLEGFLGGLGHSGVAGKGRDCNLMRMQRPLRENT